MFFNTTYNAERAGMPGCWQDERPQMAQIGADGEGYTERA